MNYRIIRSSSDDETLCNAKEVELSNIRFKTPNTVLHSDINPNSLPDIHNTYIYELWKRIEFKELEKAPMDNSVGIPLTQKINSIKRDYMRGTLKNYFLSIKFNEKNPFSKIKKSHIKFLLDTVFPITNFIIFPLIHKVPEIITNSNLCKKYINYLEECYEIAATLNNKPILGIIQPIPQNLIKNVVNFYIKKEVSTYCFDFNGYSLNSLFPNYKEFIRQLYLSDPHSFNEKFIYIINLKLPRNKGLTYSSFPAEDLLLTPLKTDIIGINHISAGGASNIKRSKKRKKSKRILKRINLLDTNNYLYQRISNKEEFNQHFQHTLITMPFQEVSAISNTERTKFSRMFNYCEKSIELHNIHNDIINNSMSFFERTKNKQGITNHDKNRISSTIRYMKAYYDITLYFK
ncbi:MAG: hypothetical protein ACTSVC_12860 [Promethearchaeota archaeon]